MYLFASTRSFACRSLLGLAVFAMAAGCQPAVEPEPGEAAVAGQVFVVTPTGESLRLGAVRVQIFHEEEIQRHLERREEALGAQREALRQEMAHLEKALEGQRRMTVLAEQAYFQREREIRVELSAFLEQMETRVADSQRQIEANTLFIESKDNLPAPPEGVPTREESEAYENRRRKWLSMNRAEREAWAEALAALNHELENNIETLHDARDDKVFAMGDELQSLDMTFEAAQRIEQETRGEIERIAAELSRPREYTDYLTDFPAPLRDVRTDADGEFLVNLPSGGRYVVFAEAERQLGGERMEFRWLVQVREPIGSRILLGNHNLVTSKTSENIITLSANSEESDT